MTRPIVCSVAGTDSGGGAGLAADHRMAEACGVHLTTAVAAVTAQNSRSVQRVEPLPADLIDAQLQSLDQDMPPVALKTGLLGSVEALRVVARWVECWRRNHPLSLVVDPVLGASTGGSFADDALVRAYREELLPLATLATPNAREAARLLGRRADAAAAADALPSLGRDLRRLGASAVCVTGGDLPPAQGRVLDWLDAPHARGWLAAPRVQTRHTHGTGCSFATAAASALARGFVAADAAVLAKMATTHALHRGHAVGAGAGPVCAGSGFVGEPGLLPWMSWGEAPVFAPPRPSAGRPLGLYAIAESADRIEALLAAGVRTIQLRIKAPADADDAWHKALRIELSRALSACREAGAELFVNDHWQLAREMGAAAVHLGQEDLLALGEEGRADLLGSGLALGVSTHSLWELCRARSMAPRMVACGPVWPTLTKAMPWRPQGLDNLAWWSRMAGVPVAAIGGILEPAQVEAAARCGVDGVCVVRGLGSHPAETVPRLQLAWRAGSAAARHEGTPGAWPHPSLDPAQSSFPGA